MGSGLGVGGDLIFFLVLFFIGGRFLYFFIFLVLRAGRGEEFLFFYFVLGVVFLVGLEG